MDDVRMLTRSGFVMHENGNFLYLEFTISFNFSTYVQKSKIHSRPLGLKFSESQRHCLSSSFFFSLSLIIFALYAFFLCEPQF